MQREAVKCNTSVHTRDDLLALLSELYLSPNSLNTLSMLILSVTITGYFLFLKPKTAVVWQLTLFFGGMTGLFMTTFMLDMTPLGFDVREAENGQEAIDIWEAWEPHLIWMDMRMPVLDGYEATKRIKNEELRMKQGEGSAALRGGSPQTIIIPLTASSFEEERAVVLKAGCDDYLRKPFREAELFELMSKHIGVKFVYEEGEGQKVKGEGQKAEEVLIPEALAALPAEWLETLKQGAERADLLSLSSVIEQIRGQDARLATALAQLAEDFEYDEILVLIQAKEAPEGRR